jgi:signal recognition particle subunit SRP54
MPPDMLRKLRAAGPAGAQKMMQEMMGGGAPGGPGGMDMASMMKSMMGGGAGGGGGMPDMAQMQGT